jgi:hypothetical protein
MAPKGHEEEIVNFDSFTGVRKAAGEKLRENK